VLRNDPDERERIAAAYRTRRCTERPLRRLRDHAPGTREQQHELRIVKTAAGRVMASPLPDDEKRAMVVVLEALEALEALEWALSRTDARAESHGGATNVEAWRAGRGR
jgi:hypothetical protein